MKKIYSFVFAALLATPFSFAQSDIEDAMNIAAAQSQLDEINKKKLNEKATKDAKKEAKKLVKAGWLVPVGELSIEKQILRSHIMKETRMYTDDSHKRTRLRYVMGTGNNIGGTYNAAFNSAHNQALEKIASSLKTRLVKISQSKVDNQQTSAVAANSVDKSLSRSKAIVDQCLTNLITVCTIYKVNKQNFYEVQVEVAFDMEELKARMEAIAKGELEDEGDALIEALLRQEEAGESDY